MGPGEQGDRGYPGENIKGPKGAAGKAGNDGITGRRGLPGKPGPAGAPGAPGAVGLPGQDGQQGPKGVRGSNGRRGLNGKRGRPGDVGLQGEPGAPGRDGVKGGRGPNGNFGDKGPVGEKGDQGPDGEPGQRGGPGQSITVRGGQGVRGLQGPKGEIGNPGMPGRNGIPGEDGLQGERGPTGPNGKDGEPGAPGLPGADANHHGFIFARHSQERTIPNCPLDTNRLWEGYSFLYTQGNTEPNSQDLGGAGSCLRHFSTMPFMFCSLNEQCDLASRNDFSYWLSTSAEIPMTMTNVNGRDVQKYISRCVVCEAKSSVMAFHSQSIDVPECPAGWDDIPMWIGYSFIMHTGVGGDGGGQNLASPGSCLETHRAAPFIECHGRGTCNYFANTYSFWLSTIDLSRRLLLPLSPILLLNLASTLGTRLSTLPTAATTLTTLSQPTTMMTCTLTRSKLYD